MSLRYRRWRRRYGIDRVPGEDGGRLMWHGVRPCWSVEPHDVGGRAWDWRVWLETRSRFSGVLQSWRRSPMEYSERRGGPHHVEGTESTRDAAEQRAREAVQDVLRRIAAAETLRNAREAARYEDKVTP